MDKNQPSSTGCVCDSTGNLKADGPSGVGNTYAWDAKGNLSQFNLGAALVYDALGRRVEQTNGSGTNEILYGPGGSKLALMSGQAVTKAFIPLPAGATALYTGATLAWYRHADWLGSSRIASTPSRAVYYDGAAAYSPFAESPTETGNIDHNFTGQNQDLAPNFLYDFLARQYHPGEGRWLSPDPAGVAAVNPANPQSWNRYAYVNGSPLSSVDPRGLCGTSTADWSFGSGCTAYAANVPTTSYMDGAPMSSEYVRQAAFAGTAAACPNGSCSGIVLDSNGEASYQYYKSQAGRGPTGYQYLPCYNGNCPVEGGPGPVPQPALTPTATPKPAQSPQAPGGTTSVAAPQEYQPSHPYRQYLSCYFSEWFSTLTNGAFLTVQIAPVAAAQAGNIKSALGGLVVAGTVDFGSGRAIQQKCTQAVYGPNGYSGSLPGLLDDFVGD